VTTSGEINMRSFGQAKMVSSKYLSDSLTPWYGSWETEGGAAVSIAYNNLAIGDSIARIYRSIAANFQSIEIKFNDPQNLNELYVDFLYKCDDPDPEIIIIFGMQAPGGAVTDYTFFRVNADGACPVVWTRKTLKVSTWPVGAGGGTGGLGRTSPSVVWRRVKTIQLLAQNIAAFPRTLEIGGFTIRRL